MTEFRADFEVLGKFDGDQNAPVIVNTKFQVPLKLNMVVFLID